MRIRFFKAVFDVLPNIFRCVLKLADAFTKTPCEFGNFLRAEQQEQCQEDEDHFLTAQTHYCKNA